MTLYCTHVGGDAISEARDFETWLGTGVRTAGWLAYTEGYRGTYDGLNPDHVINRAGHLSGLNRPVMWSIMMVPDPPTGDGVAWFVEGYRSTARGDHFAAHQEHARQMVAYANRIGDTTGPVYARTTWEVPGEWFDWNKAATEDKAAFRGAWVKWAEAMRSVSPRIKTVFDFNSDRGPVEDYYPGDAAVDVYGQDIYWIPDLQGMDPVAAFNHTRYGYSRGLQWNLDFCKAHGKPLAVSEWGLKVSTPGYEKLDHTTWVRLFFEFVDECNAPGNPGMAYVTFWNDDDANVGKFTTRAVQSSQDGVRALMRARYPGTVLGTVTAPPPPPPPTGTVENTIGTGADTLVLKLNEDAYQGNATYTVKVDGTQIGGLRTCTVLRSSGQTETLNVKGDWPAGTHNVVLNMTNDLYGGSPSTDRNLYLVSAAINGKAVAGAAWASTSSNTYTFPFTKETAPAPPPPPPPDDLQALYDAALAENAVLREQIKARDGSIATLRDSATKAIANLNTPA